MEEAKKVFIIAEAGVNHNGSVKIAKRMVDTARECGADAVKFQTFRADRLLTRFAPKAEYQKKTTVKAESQFAMIKKLELPLDAYKELMDYCRKQKIVFLSTPFDLESIDLLDKLGMKIFKISSGEITNLPYLEKIGSIKKRIILSTGMSDLCEIKNALDVLADMGTLKEKITVLHCNTEYPTPMSDVNLKAMLSIRDAFDVAVGYSDHTAGIEVAISAVALGASVIEKHFTLDKDINGPDHKASLEPDELMAMVRGIRNIEQAIGSGIKKPSLSELKNRAVVRKSIVADKYIARGEIFTPENIATKRPGSGLTPMKWHKIIGKAAKKAFREDEMIEL